MITAIRQLEYLSLLKIFARNAVDRLFYQSLHIWTSLLFFVLLYYGEFRNEMRMAEMVSTL